MIVRKEDEIFRRMLSYVLARTQMSDIRETDTITHTCASVAREVSKSDQAAWVRRNEGTLDGTSGTLLDALLTTYLPDGQTRSTGAFASGGALTFNRPTGSSGVLTVLAGTLVKRQRDGMIYRSLQNATFGIADLVSSAVSVVCLTKGSRGNVINVGEINQMASAVAGVTSCSNGSAITNGADADADEVARQSARDYVKSISPAVHMGIQKRVQDYTSATYGSVKFATWEQYNPSFPGFQTLYIDDGNGSSGLIVDQNAGGTETATAIQLDSAYTIWTRYKPVYTAPAITFGTGTPVTNPLWINAFGQAQFTLSTTPPVNNAYTFGAYKTYGGLVGEIQGLIDGILNDPEDAGIGGAGLVVTVKPALFKGYATISANVLYKTNSNPTIVAAQIKAAIVTAVNGTKAIGEGLTIADLVVIIKAVAGVEDVTTVVINSAEKDLAALPNEVIRTRTTSITLY